MVQSERYENNPVSVSTRWALYYKEVKQCIPYMNSVLVKRIPMGFCEGIFKIVYMWIVLGNETVSDNIMI